MNKIKAVLIVLFILLFFIGNSLAQPPACTISVTVTSSSGSQPSRVIGNNQVLCIDGPGTYNGSITVNSGGHLVICGGNVTVYGSVAIMPGGKYWRTPTSRIIGSFVNYGATSNNESNCSSPEPEIEINGNGQNILSGDNSPSTVKGTDFGMIEIGDLSTSQTFEINNNGDAELVISDEIVSSNSHFTVTQPSSMVVAVGSSESFEITFIPSAEGLIESTITIPNNDTDEGDFTFDVSGSGFIASLTSINSGDFEDPSNWDCNCLPESRNHIFMEHDMSMNTSFNSNEGRLFYVENDVNLSINSGANLNIAGVLMNKGFIDGNLILIGEEMQSPELGSITDLEINNSSIDGVKLSSDLSISGRLKLTQGVLDLNTYSLIMDASGTKTASIVQDNCTSYINGDVTIRQFVPEAAYGHHYLSTPMSNSVLTGWEDDFEFKLNDSYFPHLYYYDEPNQEWVTPISSDEEIVIGRGYTGYFPGERIVDLTGELNCGDISVSLSNQGDGWNLIGNPYPSMIDWDNIVIPDGLGAAIYRWDHIPSIWGRYATYIDGISVNGGTNFVPLMQGFFVHTNENVELNFTNSIRVQDESEFVSFLSSKEKEYPLIRLSVAGFDYNTEAVIRYKDDSYSFYENSNDAILFPIGNPEGVELATLSSDLEKLVVNSLHVNDLMEEVELYLKIGTPGVYTISNDDFKNFTTHSELILFDKKLDVYHSFEDGAYIFNVEKDEAEDRFKVFVNEPELGLHELIGRDLVSIIKTSNGDALLFNHQITFSDDITIINSLGQVVQVINQVGNLKKINLPNLDSGIYYIIIEIGGIKESVKWVK